MARKDAEYYVDLYQQAKTLRSPLESDWRLAAEYCAPRQVKWWRSGDGPPLPQGQTAASSLAYDATGIKSIPRWVAILMRLSMPAQQQYQTIVPMNRDLLKVSRVRAYYEGLTDLIFQYRRSPHSMLLQAATGGFASMGIYGTGPQSITWGKRYAADHAGGILYKAWRLSDCFILVDDMGRTTHFFRRMFLNARQARTKFGEDALPEKIKNELKKHKPDESARFEVFHYVCERDDHDPKSLYINRMPHTAGYVSVEDKQHIGDEEGFMTMPYIAPRVGSEPDDPYGPSPAIDALTAMGTLSAAKRTMIKQGKKAVDPAYIAADDGVLSGTLDLRAGHINYGGVNRQGQKLVHALEMGNFQIAEKIIEAEQKDVMDMFYTSLFQLLIEKEMTATEVVEMIAERISLLSPLMGRLQSEDLAPRTLRELSLLSEYGKLPPPPPEVIEENDGKQSIEYDVDFTSSMAKGAHAEEIAGYMRVTENALNIAQQMQDPSIMDNFNLDKAVPDMANFMSARVGWMRSPDEVAAMRASRQGQVETQQILDQSPAIASLAATAMKQGQGAK